MGHSSLIGVERAEPEPAGRDNAALGPSDTSDSGSDVAGIGEPDREDPSVPLDVALRDDESRPAMPPDAAASDAGGTGESRSAAGDGGAPDGSDIGVDRVFVPGLDDGEDVIPDVDVDDVDADFAALSEAATTPGQPNPEPDVPATPVPGEGDNIPGGDGEHDEEADEREHHRPGRDGAPMARPTPAQWRRR